MRRFLCGLAACVLGLAWNVPAQADDPKARSIAEEVTGIGAKAIVDRNLDAMMATYDSPAKVALFTRDGRTLKEQVYDGYEAIRNMYQDVFKGDSSFQAKNIVEEAKFLGADMLLITGIFEATADGKTNRFPFVQVRRKVGEQWRVARMQVYAFELN